MYRCSPRFVKYRRFVFLSTRQGKEIRLADDLPNGQELRRHNIFLFVRGPKMCHYPRRTRKNYFRPIISCMQVPCRFCVGFLWSMSLIKSCKFIICDTGLLQHLTGRWVGDMFQYLVGANRTMIHDNACG